MLSRVLGPVIRGSVVKVGICSIKTNVPKADAKAISSEVRVNVYNLVKKDPEAFPRESFHSGIEVHSEEYYYGVGVTSVPPRSFAETAPRFFKAQSTIQFKESIPLGETHMSASEVKELAAQLGQTRFHKKDYNRMTKNCNNFSEEFSKLLAGKGIPAWINAWTKKLPPSDVP